MMSCPTAPPPGTHGHALATAMQVMPQCVRVRAAALRSLRHYAACCHERPNEQYATGLLVDQLEATPFSPGAFPNVFDGLTAELLVGFGHYLMLADRDPVPNTAKAAVVYMRACVAGLFTEAHMRDVLQVRQMPDNGKLILQLTALPRCMWTLFPCGHFGYGLDDSMVELRIAHGEGMLH